MEGKNNEEQGKKEANPEGAAENPGAGNTSKELNKLEQFDAIAKRTEEAAARIEAANKVAVDLELRRAMGGQTQAGQPQMKKVTEEELKINNAKEFFKGTGLADAIDKANK